MKATRYPAVEPIPYPNFDLWLPALESGVLHLPELIAWADREIMRLEQPPYWLLDLSLSTKIDDIYSARSKVPASLNTAGGERFNPGLLFLGMLYMRYEAGKINLHELLLRAGDYADVSSSNDLPECEAFYYLLNEAEGRDPRRPNGRPVLERVKELFAPMVLQASAALRYLRCITEGG